MPKKNSEKKLLQHQLQKVGQSPGSLIPIGDNPSTILITAWEYNEDHANKYEIHNLDECLNFRAKSHRCWINVDGIHNVGLIEKIGKCFSLHPLLLEDIMNPTQHPKIEAYDNCLYIVLQMLYYGNYTELQSEQVSIVLMEDCVISFQEDKAGDVFEPVRQRLTNGKGGIRQKGVDYLAYSLIDSVVDHYFVALEKIEDRMESLEESFERVQDQQPLATLYTLKRETFCLRKSVWPLREIIGNMQKEEYLWIDPSIKFYFRDIYDHTVQVVETIDSFRDILAGMMDVYMSTMSYKLNEIMKVLTVISTIFIPLTFIVGIYGMNFKYMPELHWKWGYFGLLAIVGIVASSMLVYFRRKRWI